MTTGPAVRVIGSNQLRNDSSATVQSNLQLSCFVDGVSIDPTFPNRNHMTQYPGNNWKFCASDSLTDGPHIITVNATPTNNQTFWFDRIEYAPSSSISLENKTILLFWNDTAIQYGSGWLHSGADSNDSVLTLNFYGT